jgi:hypothetical protein
LLIPFRGLLQVLVDLHPDFLAVSLELQALAEEHLPDFLVDSLLDSLLVAHPHQDLFPREDRQWLSLRHQKFYEGWRKGGENSSTVSALRGVGLLHTKIVPL